MILNQQLIQGMFQQSFSKEPVSAPREDVSLNFTVSSRSSKQPKKQFSVPGKEYLPCSDSKDILDMATLQLEKFNEWFAQNQNNLSANLDNLDLLIKQIQNTKCEAVDNDDLIVIKGQLFRRCQQDENKVMQCLECNEKQQRLHEMDVQLLQNKNFVIDKANQLAFYKDQVLNQAVLDMKEYMITEVQKNILQSEIKELNQEINTLRNQKANLQRTFLFNKTRNSQLFILQKSKDLSAAKNSTGSTQIMNRNHETIVFIDPMQTDIDQWIKFFQSQKNRYKLLCKRRVQEQQKHFGRFLNRQQKQIIQIQDKQGLILNSIKEILKQLGKIRQSTASFEQTQAVKSALRQKMARNNEMDINIFKQQNEKLHTKLTKLLKINEYLLREKQNLQEINNSLKLQRLKENNQKVNIYDQLRREMAKIIELNSKLDILSQQLIDKQEQLLLSYEEIKKLKKGQATIHQKGTLQLQSKCRYLEKKVEEVKKQYEFERNSYIFKLKKEALQRKKYFNEVQQMKGPFRTYCKITSPIKDLQKIISQECSNSNLIKVIQPIGITQQKYYDDIKRLIGSAMDGYYATILSLGAQNKHHSSGYQYSKQGLALRCIRELFKHIESEKQFKAEVYLHVFNVVNDKLIDIVDAQVKEQAILGSLPHYLVESFETAQEILQEAHNHRQRFEELGKNPLITTVVLDINNLKTNQKYRSKFNIVQFPQLNKKIDLQSSKNKQGIHLNKNLTSIVKCLNAFNNKQKHISCRDSKMVQYLKESFSFNSKIFLVLQMNPNMNSEQIKSFLNFAELCRNNEKIRKNQQVDEFPIKARRSISRKNV